MRTQILIIVFTQIIVCSLQGYKTESRICKELTENAAEDTNALNLRVINNDLPHIRSSQQPWKRSSDKKPTKKKSVKSKVKKIRSTTSRTHNVTETGQNESTATTESTTTTEEARRNMPNEEEEATGSEESRSAKRDDAESLDEDINQASAGAADPAEPKHRMADLLKKTEKVVKIKESFDEQKYDLGASAAMERTTMLNMEDKLDQLISKLLKETEEAARKPPTSAPPGSSDRKAPPNPVQLHAEPTPIVQHGCNTFGSLCYNPLQQILSPLHTVLDEYPRRVMIRPRYRSIIYH